MAGEIKWSEVPSIRGPRYFRPVQGQYVKIRPIGPPYEFEEYIVTDKNGKIRSAICGDRNSCIISNKYGLTPKQKCAIQIINRSNNRIELFKASLFIFAEFKVFFEKTGKFPGATDGAHFNVRVDGYGLGATWKINFAGPNVLSESDMENIKIHGMYDMKTIFAPTDQSIIEKVLFGDTIKNIDQHYDKEKPTDQGQVKFDDLFK